MTFNLSTFQKKLKSAFKTIKKTQSEALAIEIAANYTAGRTAAEKHQSTKSAEQDEEEEGLTTEEKAEIAVLVALFLGYISKFNNTAQAQVLAEVKSMAEAGKSQAEIQQYVKDIFEGKETITIDNVGKTKKEIYVDKDLKLSEVDKVIEKPAYISVLVYASLTGGNASHAAYEKGREMKNRSDGFDKWVFVGPVDERARPWHIALVGEVFTYGTQQSNYAEKVLRDHGCRHRAYPYFNDSRDTKPEVWQKLKDEAGLYWDETKQAWQVKF